MPQLSYSFVWFVKIHLLKNLYEIFIYKVGNLYNLSFTCMRLVKDISYTVITMQELHKLSKICNNYLHFSQYMRYWCREVIIAMGDGIANLTAKSYHNKSSDNGRP